MVMVEPFQSRKCWHVATEEVVDHVHPVVWKTLGWQDRGELAARWSGPSAAWSQKGDHKR